MKMKLKFLIMILTLALIVTGCSSEENSVDTNAGQIQNSQDEEGLENEKENYKIDKKINVLLPAGTPALSMIKMIYEDYEVSGYDMDYEIINSTDLLSAKILSEEADILIIPTNLAAKLHSKNIDYKLKTVNVWGSLYIISNGNSSMRDIEDLSGKEVYTIGEGLTPDIITKYILKKNNVSDVSFKYLAGATELAPMFLSGKSEVTLMPEPMLSLVRSKKDDINVVVDLQSEWMKLSSSSLSYPQSGLYINSKILKDESFTDEFLKEVERSITWLNENPELAGQYYEELASSPPSDIIRESIGGSNIRFERTENIKDAMKNYFEILYSEDPDSIGGIIPSEDLYE